MRNGVAAVWVWTEQARSSAALEEQEGCDMQCDTADKSETPCCRTGCGRQCGGINGEDREVENM